MYNPTGIYLLTLALLAGYLPSQAMWSLQNPANGPGGRNLHCMAFDSQRGVAVLFGGDDGISRRGDTWEWDGLNWHLVSNAGPIARSGATMTYDSVRGRTILFGGVGAPGYLGDTWEWDGVAWSQVAAAGPSAGHLYSMAFDPIRGVAVLVAGGSTWEWNGTSWTQRLVPGPSSGSYSSMTFDEGRGVTVFYGGGTWEWDGVAWSLRAWFGPPPRAFHALSYDVSRGTSILYGGYTTAVHWSDMCEWDGSGWRQLTVYTASPGPRRAHAMVYDSARSQLVLFGGDFSTSSNGSTIDPGSYVVYGDTWDLEPPTAATVTPYGASCGMPPITLAPAAGSRPLMGSSLRSMIDNAYLGIALVAWGHSNTMHQGLPLPLPLDAIGMDGCFLLQSAEEIASGCTSTSWATAEHTLAIPFDQQLLGLHVYMQAWTFAPGYNPIGLVTSNGVELVIGDV